MGNCSNTSNDQRREREKNQKNSPKSNNIEQKNEIQNQQNDNIINSKEQDNNTNINYYLICPDCLIRSPHIEKLYYDENSKDFLVKYTCICSNNAKSKETPLNRILDNKEPLNLCTLHQENKLIGYCKTCKRAICSICKQELHINHKIDMDIINKAITRENADNMLKIIKEKEQKFNEDINKNEEKMENGINNMIQKLNEDKINYKKQIENYKDNNLKTFDFLKNLYSRYINNFEENKNNDNVNKSIVNHDNNINSNDIMLANHINNFVIKDKNITTLNTNIDEIINQFSDEKKELKLDFDYGFSKKDINNTITEENIELEASVNQNNYNKKNSQNIIELEASVNQNNYKNNNSYNMIDFICTKTLGGHTEKIVSLIELTSGQLVTGSYDNTIRIWNENYDKEDIVIEEKSRILCLLEFEKNKILCGTSNNLINLYGINGLNYEYLYTFVGHTLWINCLVKINNYYFASASNDTKIKIWDYYNKKCLKTLEGHTDCILSLILLKNNLLCSGGADLVIRIWDWDNNKCLQILKGHEKWVKCVFELDNEIIVSGSDDKSIKLWKDNINIKTLMEHTNSVRSFCQINSKYFASGSFDCTIKIWEINTWICVQTLEGHDSNIISIITINYNIKQKNNDNDYVKKPALIASCSNDKTLKIWEEKI